MLIFITGCAVEGLESLQQPSLTLTTDKELYHSGEVMHISSHIVSSTALNNVSVRFYGIYAGRYRLDQNTVVDLNKGENDIEIDYNAPRCYGCSGIQPGTYSINVAVSYNGEVLANSSVNVEIRQ